MAEVRTCSTEAGLPAGTASCLRRTIICCRTSGISKTNGDGGISRFEAMALGSLDVLFDVFMRKILPISEDIYGVSVLPKRDLSEIFTVLNQCAFFSEADLLAFMHRG